MKTSMKTPLIIAIVLGIAALLFGWAVIQGGHESGSATGLELLSGLAAPAETGETAEPPALVAAPGTGRVWILVGKSTYHASDVRRWARRIEDLRRMAAEGGGNVRIESAPVELRRVVDSWGDPGQAARIGKGIKKQFDPHAILKPGFLRRGGGSDRL